MRSLYSSRSLSQAVYAYEIFNCKHIGSVFLVVSMLTCLSSYAQNRIKVHHIIKRSVIESGRLPVVYKDSSGNQQPFQFCAEKLFAVIRMGTSGPEIDFLPVKPGNAPNDRNCISDNTDPGSFEIKLTRRRLGDPAPVVKVPFGGWIAGVGTVPLRLRASTAKVASTLSSQVGINITYGKYFGFSTISQRSITHYGMMIGPFLGVTSVRLEKSTIVDPTAWPIDRTNAAITYGLNVSVMRSNLGVVLFWGYDHNFGKDAAAWGYQNKPWLGLGINTYIGVF